MTKKQKNLVLTPKASAYMQRQVTIRRWLKAAIAYIGGLIIGYILGSS